ncbi:uncharacterized protein [Amphiura filiformis]|uniref:uncharacterized protein n=1 Tax=Amphiura filiformis TaxID=82378 RepID=UPI003B218A78
MTIIESKQDLSISKIMRDLHWLPIRKRIAFKISLLTFKALHGQAPPYISELITPYTPYRTLRSSTQNLLKAPRRRPRTAYGRRSFAEDAYKEWNNLTSHVRLAPSINAFKAQLKTFLFNQ